MVKTVGEQQFLAPIDEDKVHRVLDVGTGTGICGFSSCGRLGGFWDGLLTRVSGAMEFGDMYPGMEVSIAWNGYFVLVYGAVG